MAGLGKNDIFGSILMGLSDAGNSYAGSISDQVKGRRQDKRAKARLDDKDKRAKVVLDEAAKKRKDLEEEKRQRALADSQAFRKALGFDEDDPMAFLNNIELKTGHALSPREQEIALEKYAEEQGKEQGAMAELIEEAIELSGAEEEERDQVEAITNFLNLAPSSTETAGGRQEVGERTRSLLNNASFLNIEEDDPSRWLLEGVNIQSMRDAQDKKAQRLGDLAGKAQAAKDEPSGAAQRRLEKKEERKVRERRAVNEYAYKIMKRGEDAKRAIETLENTENKEARKFVSQVRDGAAMYRTRILIQEADEIFGGSEGIPEEVKEIWGIQGLFTKQDIKTVINLIDPALKESGSVWGIWGKGWDDEVAAIHKKLKEIARSLVASGKGADMTPTEIIFNFSDNPEILRMLNKREIRALEEAQEATLEEIIETLLAD